MATSASIDTSRRRKARKSLTELPAFEEDQHRRSVLRHRLPQHEDMMMHVDTIDERLRLFRQMAEHSGLDADAMSGVGKEELLAAAQRCLGCRVGEECRSWLEEVPGNQPPAGFCRNVSRFQMWVEREISREIHQLDTLIAAAELHPAQVDG